MGVLADQLQPSPQALIRPRSLCICVRLPCRAMCISVCLPRCICVFLTMHLCVSHYAGGLQGGGGGAGRGALQGHRRRVHLGRVPLPFASGKGLRASAVEWQATLWDGIRSG